MHFLFMQLWSIMSRGARPTLQPKLMVSGQRVLFALAVLHVILLRIVPDAEAVRGVVKGVFTHRNSS